MMHLAPNDNAVMQSDDVALMTLLVPTYSWNWVDSCLTSDRKSHVELWWHNRKIKSQTIKDPSELCCTPVLSSPLIACSISQGMTVRKWSDCNLNFCRMNGALPVPDLICCRYMCRFTLWRAASVPHTHIVSIYTCDIWLDICHMTLRELLLSPSVWKEHCIWGLATTNKSVIGCSLSCCGLDFILSNKHCVTCCQQHSIVIWFRTILVCGATTNTVKYSQGIEHSVINVHTQKN